MTQQQDAPRRAASTLDQTYATAGSGRPSDSPEERPIMRFDIGTLNQNWYIACQSHELSTKKPLGVTIMDEPIVLFRGKKGQAVALIDRCLHRNARLSAGEVFDGCIGCPYHGWTYSASGTCVFVPSEGPTGEGGEQAEAPTGRGKLKIERFPTFEQDGFVWVWMGDPAKAEGREPFRYPHTGDGWKRYVMVTGFEGDVTDLAENFMDVPHTAFVHSGWFRKADMSNMKRAEAVVERTEDSVLVEYFQEDDAIGFASWALNPDKKPMTHTDKFYMPNCTRVDYMWGERRGFIITSQCTPISRDRAVVYTAIHFKFGFLNPFMRRFLPWYTRVVINQDVDIMDVQTRNLARFGRRRFHSTEADVIHRSIESLREHALSGEAGPPPEPMKTKIAFWM